MASNIQKKINRQTVVTRGEVFSRARNANRLNRKAGHAVANPTGTAWNTRKDAYNGFRRRSNGGMGG